MKTQLNRTIVEVLRKNVEKLVVRNSTSPEGRKQSEDFKKRYGVYPEEL